MKSAWDSFLDWLVMTPPLGALTHLAGKIQAQQTKVIFRGVLQVSDAEAMEIVGISDAATRVWGGKA